MAEEEEEYKSDPEEATRYLAMRRREASDDEGENAEEDGETLPVHRRSDDDSDGQGGVEEYRDEEEVEEEGEEEVSEEEIYEEDGLLEEGDFLEREEADADEGIGEDARERNSMVAEPAGEDEDVGHVAEEKKENEPFAVPTAGAFYMHDDRFRNIARGRNKRILGGRKLWESKDERKWGHDKFEEMSLRERRNDDGRRGSRGYFRGRGRNPSGYRSYPKGSRANTHPNNYNRSHAPKSVRGRGPRRYEFLRDNDDNAPEMQNRQLTKPLGRMPRGNLQRVSEPVRNVEPDKLPQKKQVLTSRLSSASPPFYPSSSSNKDVQMQQQDPRTGLSKRNLHDQNFDERSSLPRTSPMARERNLTAIGISKLSIDDPVSSAARKSSANLHPSSSSGSVPLRRQGSALSHPTGSGFMFIQPSPTHKQLNMPSLAQMQAVQQSLVQGRAGSSSEIPHQHGESGSPSSSHSAAIIPSNSVEPEQANSSPESDRNKASMVEKERGGVQGGRQGSFLHGGAQVMGAYGNLALSHGDQKFPGTPAILPVMQFSGQHPGSIGVPAVGMAFPGYVAPPRPGMGSSEMTWLPVLAGAGTLGAAYCPQYLTGDGAYQTRSSGDSSPGASSNENNASKADNDGKISLRFESLSNGYEQPRQHKPRRYSEMNLGQ